MNHRRYVCGRAGGAPAGRPAEHDVATRGTGVKHLRHPIVDDLTITWNTLSRVVDPEQHIIVWTAEPNTPSADLTLAIWHPMTRSAGTIAVMERYT